MLSEEQIKQFQALYQKNFRKEISREEAFEQGTKLLRLVELIYRPMTEEEYKKYDTRRNN